MRSLIFILLAGCAVRCDDSSYYVIEIPEEHESQEHIKPFRVYWNVPTMQCRSKKIPFNDLLEKFGIIQNSNDSFRGEKIAILYDPGLFPALLKNETSGKFKFRNGGVPQEGDLDKHLVAFRSVLEQSVPDKNFDGVGIIDFESWRPVFRQNFGVLIPYKDISYQIERRMHWFWTEKEIKYWAKQRFEKAAKVFMQTTLSVAKQMRPRALWGYYGFPYCFNGATNNIETCSDKVKQENDGINWLWSESTALYPSIYSSKDLTTSQLASLVRGRAGEAGRVRRRGAPVLPYFWFRYREGGYLEQEDLDAVLDTLYKSNTSGFIIWGSSSDVNTVDKCKNLLSYTEQILGPTIARYTKAHIRNMTNVRPSSNSGITTWRPIFKDRFNDTNKIDPDYHWDPPQNYTQSIVHYVEEELNKKKDKVENDSALVNVNRNTILGLLFSMLNYNSEPADDSDGSNSQIVSEFSDDSVSSSTAGYKSSSKSDNAQEMAVTSFTTKNPLDSTSKNRKNGTIGIDFTSRETEMTDSVQSTSSIVNTLVTSTPNHSTRGYAYTDNENENASEIIKENITTQKPYIYTRLSTNQETTNNDNPTFITESYNENSVPFRNNTTESSIESINTNVDGEEIVDSWSSQTENNTTLVDSFATSVHSSLSTTDISNISSTDNPSSTTNFSEEFIDIEYFENENTNSNTEISTVKTENTKSDEILEDFITIDSNVTSNVQNYDHIKIEDSTDSSTQSESIYTTETGFTDDEELDINKEYDEFSTTFGETTTDSTIREVVVFL